jgi:hypothetical protein
MWLYPFEGKHKYPAHEFGDAGHSPRREEIEALATSISTQWGC